MRSLIEKALTEAGSGDAHTLIGLVDYMIQMGTPLSRILDIGERAFGIPRNVMLNTVKLFV